MDGGSKLNRNREVRSLHLPIIAAGLQINRHGRYTCPQAESRGNQRRSWGQQLSNRPLPQRQQVKNSVRLLLVEKEKLSRGGLWENIGVGWRTENFWRRKSLVQAFSKSGENDILGELISRWASWEWKVGLYCNFCVYFIYWHLAKVVVVVLNNVIGYVLIRRQK